MLFCYSFELLSEANYLLSFLFYLFSSDWCSILNQHIYKNSFLILDMHLNILQKNCTLVVGYFFSRSFYIKQIAFLHKNFFFFLMECSFLELVTSIKNASKFQKDIITYMYMLGFFLSFNQLYYICRCANYIFKPCLVLSVFCEECVTKFRDSFSCYLGTSG